MVSLEKERLELLSDIHKLGYESLRYSIFNDHGPREWETRIEYNPELEVYEVYSTMDRASTNGKDSYQTFQEARIRFIEILKNVVFINRYYVDEGIGAEYSSPLWDKIEADIENIKCIVEQEIKKRHFESLHYVLFDENKNLPWAFHLFYRDGKFMINGRDDRSYVMGNTIEFTSFEDAKIAFLERLEHFVKSNQFKVKIGKKTYYPSPLWDDTTE
ncbi:Imm59 family immunity protein [Salmonella enterica]|nr:Imm59 family immunity protein [Salmonella enterica]